MTEPEARGYLTGFDDHADVIDIPHLGPIETQPEQVVIHDRAMRRWTVHTATGVVVIVRDPMPQHHARERVISSLDGENAVALADALVWSARIAEPRSLEINEPL